MYTSIEKNTGDYLIFQVGYSFYKEEKEQNIDQKGNKRIDFFLCKNLQFSDRLRKSIFFQKRKSLRFKSLLEINEKIMIYKIVKNINKTIHRKRITNNKYTN